MVNKIIIDKFNNGVPIKHIAKEFNINRKKLSLELQQLGFITNNKVNAINLTNEDIENIIEMYNKNFSFRKIARNKGVSHHHIKEILIKNNILNKDTCDPLKDIIYDYYFNKKLSTIQIMDILNISEKYIRDVFINNEWNFRSYGRKYIFNEYKFHYINTHEKAYWLGFLFADGYNNELKGELEITLKREDEEHLVKFLNFMESNKLETKDKIAKIENKEYPASRITLDSKILSDKLHEIGCVKAKSLIVRMPNDNILDKKFYSSFIAGYFDGNGHIGIYDEKVHIGFYSGNEKMLIDIQNILEIENNILINTKINTRFNNSYSFQYICNGSENAKRLYNYCFTSLPKNTYLKRKQDIFGRLV